MTKYWVPGKVKTRLGSTIGMAPAADLHKLFVSKLCDTLSNAADERCLCITPEKNLSNVKLALEQWELSPKWRVTSQVMGDLGARMSGWFQQTLGTSGNNTAILIGGDCPLLSENDIAEAADCLHQSDVVLGPACDGGYYLIGISGPWRPELETIFKQIPWSTNKVLSLTRQKLAQANLKLTELAPREDIDTERELVRLLQANTGNQRPDRDEHGEFFQAVQAILRKPLLSERGNE